MEQHNDPWVGYVDMLKEQGYPDNRVPWGPPWLHYGGSRTTWIPPEQLYMDLVQAALDPELIKQQHFELVYVARNTFPMTTFWTFMVCYRYNNPEWKKGARGIPESLATTAFFPYTFAGSWLKVAS